MAKSDDKKFNETLQNLLKTPPEPHKPKGNKPRKRVVKKSAANKSERAARKDKRARP